MCVIIIMNNITISYYNYFIRYYSKDFVRYHKFIECFGFICDGSSPSPPPLAILTAQQELKNIYVSTCIIIYAIYSRISQDKKVFNLANKI